MKGGETLSFLEYLIGGPGGFRSLVKLGNGSMEKKWR
jgi:hypothetical protein